MIGRIASVLLHTLAVLLFYITFLMAFWNPAESSALAIPQGKGLLLIQCALAACVTCGAGLAFARFRNWQRTLALVLGISGALTALLVTSLRSVGPGVGEAAPAGAAVAREFTDDLTGISVLALVTLLAVACTLAARRSASQRARRGSDAFATGSLAGPSADEAGAEGTPRDPATPSAPRALEPEAQPAASVGAMETPAHPHRTGSLARR